MEGAEAEDGVSFELCLLLRRAYQPCVQPPPGKGEYVRHEREGWGWEALMSVKALLWLDLALVEHQST